MKKQVWKQVLASGVLAAIICAMLLILFSCSEEQVCPVPDEPIIVEVDTCAVFPDYPEKYGEPDLIMISDNLQTGHRVIDYIYYCLPPTDEYVQVSYWQTVALINTGQCWAFIERRFDGVCDPIIKP